MSIIDTILDRLGYAPKGAQPERPGVNAMSVQEFGQWMRENYGDTLTERTALAISAIYAAAGLIAGAIAGLPLHIYETSSEGRSRVEQDPLWDILNIEMAPGWAAPVAWEYLVMSLLLHGNFYAAILRKGGGLTIPAIVGFEPVHPSLVQVRREPITRRLVYIVHPDPVDTGGDVRVIDQDDMIHVPGFGFDGRIGYSPLRLALGDAGSLAKSAQDLSKDFFKNGARPDFYLLTDGKLPPEQIAELRQNWNEQHRGTGKGFAPAILTGGMKPHAISLPMDEIQMVAQRQFQIEEIARIFGVPPFMIGHTEKTTSWGSGVEQMGIGFVKYTLQRHLSKIQTEFRRKCFRRTNRFAEFATAALERGDLKTQSEAFRIALGRAGEANWMTVNEVRRLLNMSPVEGGDAMRSASDKPAVTAEDLK